MSSVSQMLEEKIQAMKMENNYYEVGRVIGIRSTILDVSGLEGAFYFEKVRIADKAEGYVESISADRVKVALTRIDEPVCLQDEVIAAGKRMTARFSSQAIGHVVDMFGMDKLNQQRFADTFETEIETPPIPIMERTAVCRPMLTGITGIDMLYPIGRGQRQLIIGDKKTGKTQITLDAIVNQKDQDMLCIYVAIGKTKKDVKTVYQQLLEKGAMSYTVIVAAFNDEPSPVLKNTPYAALSLAEHYMRSGKDVLVVLDDLKRHADGCREIALLQGKTPGRDAYPPDIFYIHSRMLEKGCQYQNGASITILPICETKGGDITDYISTNIISITDGQIVLSKKNFDRGQKPAINYGLSVSRLGGAVQTSSMKKLGSKIRNELLSYLEQREVYELANMDEMSPELRERMQRGGAILASLIQYKFKVRTPQEMLDQFQTFRGESE